MMMAKTKPAKTQAERNKRQGNRCWPGYEPTPGKKPGAKGSCKPKHPARTAAGKRAQKKTAREKAGRA
jgi:hypothetical protein